MAAFEVIALDTATPQLRAPGASDTYTFPRAVEMPLGTANGVLYLDGSKVVTSGSALTFDGTNFRNTSGAFEGIDNMTLSALVSLTNATVLTLNSAGTSGTTRFQINGSEQMRLTSTGLGIGTSSPAYKLDVEGSQRIRKTGAGYNAEMLSFSTIAETGAVYRMGMATGGVFAIGRSDVPRTDLTLDSLGNLGLGTSSFGTSAAGVLSIGNGTEPSTGPANTVQVYSVDLSAGNTIPAVYCEGSGVTGAGITNVTVTHKIAIKVNGTVYYLLATTNAT
jgi:hypothetical protein